MSTLDGPIWSKRSCTLTWPARSHFQRTQSKERWGQGWDERYRSSRQGGECGDKEGQEKRKRENRRPILKKLYAVLLRSFKGQHSKEMKGSAQGNWDPREGQQPFFPNPNGAGDRTTTLRWLLIGAGCASSLLIPLLVLYKTWDCSQNDPSAPKTVYVTNINPTLFCVRG